MTQQHECTALRRDVERALRELDLIRRHLGLDRKDGWTLRLRILRSIFECGGHIRSAAAKAGAHHSTLYRHYNKDPIFRACWDWVVAEARRAQRSTDPPTWNEIWPEQLPEPIRGQVPDDLY